MINLRSLYLQNTKLTGSVPSEICTSGLTYMSLSGSEVTCLEGCVNNFAYGSIPCPPTPQEQTLCALVAATNVSSVHSAWACNVAGYPVTNPCLSAWPGVECHTSNVLRALTLSNNEDISGTLPSELGYLTELTTLSLHNLGLTGTVPDELGSMVSLVELNLTGNLLSGDVPSSLCDLATYAAVTLLNNSFTCYPSCQVNSNDVYGLSGTPTWSPWEGRICQSDVDVALCSLISATNISSIAALQTWECNSDGNALSNPCNWDGIHCSGSDVIVLSLAGMELVGTVPSELGRLTAMTNLDLGERSTVAPTAGPTVAPTAGSTAGPTAGPTAGRRRRLMWTNYLTGRLIFLVCLPYPDTLGYSFLKYCVLCALLIYRTSA